MSRRTTSVFIAEGCTIGKPAPIELDQFRVLRHDEVDASHGLGMGGIAVVVSLIYLASQIRQNSRLLRAPTSAATGQNILSFQNMTIQDPEKNRIYWDGLDDRSALSEPDRRRFDPLLMAHFQIYLQQYGFAHDGIGDPRLWEQQIEGLR